MACVLDRAVLHPALLPISLRAEFDRETGMTDPRLDSIHQRSAKDGGPTAAALLPLCRKE
jgi:hypothetical protein